MHASSMRILMSAAAVAWLGWATSASAQDNKVDKASGRKGDQQEMFNYDEALAGSYTLPEALVLRDGRAVTTPEVWRNERRGELLRLFEEQVYGHRLSEPARVEFRVLDSDRVAGGKGTRKKIDVRCYDARGAAASVPLTLIVPRESKGPVPAFVGLHLFDTATAEPELGKVLEEDVGEALPGKRMLEVLLSRGYAVATLDAKDFCPDDKEKFRAGLLSTFSPQQTGSPGPEEGGAIATWTWALSRALDYLQTDADVDGKRVAVIGHSRMGKTALWAGAQDERFALVISNNSGCGGAALSRRWFGETVARITRSFPHWFCGNFTRYGGHEDQLPVDQHELIALVAPRPVYVASAQEDGWADPKGEFLAAVGAGSVYRLLGKTPLETVELPPLAKPIGKSVGYHLRPGKHALTDYDWLRYLDFADRQFR